MPERRQDIHFARLMALLASIYRNPEKNPEPFEPKVYMPTWWDDPVQAKKAQTPEEIYLQFRTWAMIARRKAKPQ